MRMKMEDDIKRWTAKRKSALVLDVIQGKAAVAEASRQYDLSPSEVEQWVDDGRRGMENALRANPPNVREQYERQLKDRQGAYGEAMLELRARKYCGPRWARTRSDRDWHPRGPARDRELMALPAGPLVRRIAPHRLLQAGEVAANGRSEVRHTDQSHD